MILRIILTCFLTSVISLLSAQSDLSIEMISSVEGNIVRLRWVPITPEVFEFGARNGYTLTRYRYRKDTTLLRVSAMDSSAVVLMSQKLPLGESSWKDKYPNNDFATVARKVLFNPLSVSDGPPSLADAIAREQERDSRYTFALFAAEQDFRIAEDMGIGAADEMPDDGFDYVYSILTTDNIDTIESAIIVLASDETILPTPSQPLAEGFDHGFVLRWDTDSLGEYYSSYDIERSLDNQTFERANSVPYLFSSEEGVDDKIAVYRDSLADNTTKYYYRVLGRTSFGTNGPPSPTAEVKGKEPSLSIELSLSQPKIADDGAAIEFDWSKMTGATTEQLEGFRILVSLDPIDNFRPITNSYLSPSTRQYEYIGADPVGYYRLEATDRNGYIYMSPSVLVQLPDETPPSLPTRFSGKFLSNEKVQLTWKSGSERDLAGYRIFMGNSEFGTFTQVTVAAVADSQYVYEIDPGFMVDSIYFKILATDYRDNMSNRSDPIGIPRPDIVPPAKPSLYKANPTPGGVQIGFKFSASPDVDRHVLERRRKNTRSWESILTIPIDDEPKYAEDLTPEQITPTCYLDTTKLERRPYQYRLLAYDRSTNTSTSPYLDVTPYDSGERGTITDFTTRVEYYPAQDLPEPEPYDLMVWINEDIDVRNEVNQDSLGKLAIFKAITVREHEELKIERNCRVVHSFLEDRKIAYCEEHLYREVVLEWNYDMLEQLQDFQIYRSAEGGVLQLYKTLPIETLNRGYRMVDKDVRSGRRYIYQITARHTDAGFSERSGVRMVRVR